MPNGVEIHGKEKRPAPHARARKSRLASGVARADHNDVEMIHHIDPVRIFSNWKRRVISRNSLHQHMRHKRYAFPASLSIVYSDANPSPADANPGFGEYPASRQPAVM